MTDRTLRPLLLTRRRVLRVLLFLASSALVAFALGTGLREILPYEAFRKRTAEERFLMWEGVLWLLGLAMVFFGGAVAFGTLGYGHLYLPAPQEIRYDRDLRRATAGAGAGSWWVVCTGAFLLALAIHARANLPG